MFSRLLKQITTVTNSLTRQHLEWFFRIATRSPLKVIAASLLLVVLSANYHPSLS